jgi:hypothetical protein
MLFLCKKLIKAFFLVSLVYPNLLIAKNFEIPNEGIVIKKISCLDTSNNQVESKSISMLIYNKNDFPMKSKVLNFDLLDEDGDRLFSHIFILQMAPRTATKQVLTVPDCNDSFFGRKYNYKFQIKS